MFEQSDIQLKQRILSYLELNCQGRANAVPKHQIMKDLRINRERALRSCIHQLRVEENPILSACKPPAGFFIPVNPEEVEEAMRQFKNRVINQNQACAGIRKGLRKKFPGDIQYLLDFDLSA